MGKLNHRKRSSTSAAEVFVNAGPDAMADRKMAHKRRTLIKKAASAQSIGHAADENSDAWTHAERDVDESLKKALHDVSHAAPKRGVPSDAALNGNDGDLMQPIAAVDEDTQSIDRSRGIVHQQDQQKTDTKHRARLLRRRH